MAESAEGAGFWLPSEFLTDDDFLMDKENINNSTGTESEFLFPTEFPYDFEAKRDEHFEKFWEISTSPQSTLTRLGSFSGRSAGGSSNGSPRTTPFGSKYDAVENMIHRAAGQVANLKLNNGDVFDHDLWAPPRSMAQFYPQTKTPNPPVFQKTQFQQQMLKEQNRRLEMLYLQQYQNRRERAVEGMGQDAWTIQQNPTRLGGPGSRAVGSGSGSAARRGCGGTGVFLPRGYGNNNDSNASSSNPRYKQGYSTSLNPDRAGVHDLTNNFDNMNGFAQSQPEPELRFNRRFTPDHNTLMARRQAMMLQQQRNLLLMEGSSMMSREMYLPRKWTY